MWVFRKDSRSKWRSLDIVEIIKAKIKSNRAIGKTWY